MAPHDIKGNNGNDDDDNDIPELIGYDEEDDDIPELIDCGEYSDVLEPYGMVDSILTRIISTDELSLDWTPASCHVFPESNTHRLQVADRVINGSMRSALRRFRPLGVWSANEEHHFRVDREDASASENCNNYGDDDDDDDDRFY